MEDYPEIPDDYDPIPYYSDPLFPPEVFTHEQLRNGAILLHWIGLIYASLAMTLATVEFQVPALGVISEKLNLNEDASVGIVFVLGTSFTKLATGIIGAFASFSDVGIGTVVGSNVYNVVFAIGFCMLFTSLSLRVTTANLVGNFVWYIICLIILPVFFLDEVFSWYESLSLVVFYGFYAVYLGTGIKKKCSKSGNHIQMEPVHQLNTIFDGKSDAEAPGVITHINPSEENPAQTAENILLALRPKPMTLGWPSDEGCLEKFCWVVLLPVSWLVWLTMPDPRKEKSRKFFIITLLISFVWQAVCSYLIVWWGTTIGETNGIPPEVFGLTTLASAMSLPSVIPRILMAQGGFGDALLVSSVAINIYDISFSLAVPILIGNIFNGGDYPVSSAGMVCSVTLLIVIILMVFIFFACAKCRLNPCKRFTCIFGLILYAVFVAISLGFAYAFFACPI